MLKKYGLLRNRIYMLFMLVVKASNNSEAENLPNAEHMEAMTKYNQAEWAMRMPDPQGYGEG